MINRALLQALLLSCLAILVCFRPVSVAGAEGPPTDEHRLAPLGPGDTIAIQVYGQPDMNTTVYIGDNGSVSVPLVGAVQVSGLSPVEAATHIEEALKAGQYLVDPHVTVTVVLSRSQRVSVLGEVRNPGLYPLDPNGSVLELIAQAGGLADTGADFAYVVRTEQGKEVRYRVNTRVAGADPGSNDPPVALRSGDSIIVPRADQFYIYGEVASPNMYRIEPNMTVVQAIARAGGVSQRGSEHRVDIKRKDAQGRFIVVHAKLNDPVKPDDVIRVKESIF